MKGRKKQAARKPKATADVPRKPRTGAARPNAEDDRDREIARLRREQAATGEILRIIASSPTDVQPVFESIVASAQALTAAETSAVFVVSGFQVNVAAVDGGSPEAVAAWRAQYPREATPGTVVGRAVLERQAIHVPDFGTDSRYATAPGRLLGVRTILAVPMLRDGEPIGVVVVWRKEVKPFSATQIDLMRTFADQAVIAVQNVRLFTELEAKNSALTSALDQQTATGEILRIIASSPTDVQPVFKAIVESAVRLCGGVFGTVITRQVDELHLRAGNGFSDDRMKSMSGLFRSRYRRICRTPRRPDLSIR